MTEQTLISPEAARQIELSVLCREAIAWLPELERADAEAFVEWLLDSVIDLLKDDPTTPPRTDSDRGTTG